LVLVLKESGRVVPAGARSRQRNGEQGRGPRLARGLGRPGLSLPCAPAPAAVKLARWNSVLYENKAGKTQPVETAARRMCALPCLYT